MNLYQVILQCFRSLAYLNIEWYCSGSKQGGTLNLKKSGNLLVFKISK